MSTLKLSIRQWKKIRAELQTEHPKTVFMLRNKMKTILGFYLKMKNHKRCGLSRLLLVIQMFIMMVLMT